VEINRKYYLSGEVARCKELKAPLHRCDVLLCTWQLLFFIEKLYQELLMASVSTIVFSRPITRFNSFISFDFCCRQSFNKLLNAGHAPWKLPDISALQPKTPCRWVSAISQFIANFAPQNRVLG